MSQVNLPSILALLLSKHDNVRTAAMAVVTLIVRLGFVHPMKVGEESYVV